MSVSADTIFALSSGAPPAAIGVIRISGPSAFDALKTLIKKDLFARRPSLCRLLDRLGRELDHALVIKFPGPATATGEDLVELHCHGGRAVIAAIEQALQSCDGLRKATPGEFTRRAFTNGRIDLSEAEGLADLLSAETELQRASAVEMAGGAFSKLAESWRSEVLRLSALVEAALDFSDEDDVSVLPVHFGTSLSSIFDELDTWLRRPRAERLGEGVRVVLAGPPNAGKSTLFNALTESEAAITSPIAGTTRDVIQRSVSISGIPFLFIDTAGLRVQTNDEIEQIGIDRAHDELQRSDIVLWLGQQGCGPDGAWEIAPQSDTDGFVAKEAGAFEVSAVSGEGIDGLRGSIVARARELLPKPGDAALNARQHGLVGEAAAALRRARETNDPLLIGEELRTARTAFDRLIGRAATEDMLDALFGRFCIGK